MQQTEKNESKLDSHCGNLRRTGQLKDCQPKQRISRLDKVKSRVFSSLVRLDKSKEGVLKLAKNTSIELLEERTSLQEALKTCRNICKFLEISDENAWLDLELNGYLVKYKTKDELCENLPAYRRTAWMFYDVYGNMVTLPQDIMDLFGKSLVYHSIQELENKDLITIESKLLERFNKFISEHGMDYPSKSVRIHEARISKAEINRVLEGIKKRVQELLDIIISLLEFS